ncbi:kelch 17 [Micractinium conductrix]|uniref:Kelch 17 n=1 Tax=Micractinium conductrix TaxID=554055 RepID=A0A2P6V825_9CHLO|nr:kelch 17 [Micractinium conductrix]|eukprot:PSC70244.1 kelch 17 [Micractinium conductrix]
MSELECQEEVHGVSHGAAVVAGLVLQDLDSPAHPFTCPPTEEGLEALALLQRAVFGADSLEQRRGFTDCFLYASLGQALRAHELTTAALLDALAPHNCLSLFNAAAACGCAPLRRAARALALRSFTAAWQADPNGLMTMEEAHLLALLSSDSLQVESELEVFQALAAWTQYYRDARLPGLAPRLARCVRLATLAMPELHVLGDHPLILKDRPTNQLVALTVIHLSMGQVLHAPLGMPTNIRRRRCLRGDDAAPAQQQQQLSDADRRCCGQAGHEHGSVFEAAACAFAQQSAARADAAADVAAAGLRRLSVEGCQGGAVPAEEPAAPGSTARVAPASPPAVEAPTPTAASHAAAVPALVPTSRVRHVGIGKRVSSRRTLFGMGGDDAPGKQLQLQAGSDGDKATAAPAPPAAATHAASGSSSGGEGIMGGLRLEMSMSPNHASLRGLAAQAAAAAQPLPLTNSASRKKLRFN